MRRLVPTFRRRAVHRRFLRRPEGVRTRPSLAKAIKRGCRASECAALRSFPDMSLRAVGLKNWRRRETAGSVAGNWVGTQ
jgi:hypothetical protein